MDASAWITLVLAVFAGLSAWVAFRQTRLQKRIQRDTMQPHVWADFRLDPRWHALFRLVVGNEGPTVATDVVVTLDPPLEFRNEYADPGRFASIPPGRVIAWDVGGGAADERLGSDLPRRYRVRIEGEGPLGGLDPLEYVLDLSEYLGMAQSPPGTLHGVTKEIASLSKMVKDLSKTLDRQRHQEGQP